MPTDIALLIVRLVVGFLVFGHGAMKLFGWFGGHGFTATATGLGGHLRLRPAKFWTLVASLSEAGGGLLFALGLFTPLGALGIAAAMFSASVLAHWGKLWGQNGGMELPLTYLSTAIAIGLTGPGGYSLDALFGISFPTPAAFLYGLVLVAIGLALMLLTRAPAPATASAPQKESVSRAT